MNSKFDVYERITASILEVIVAGCGKFEMPWHTSGAMPSNAHSQRRYRGVNVLVLWGMAARYGFQTNLWATYQQWSELGAQVRKGSKSATIVFWKFYDEQTEGDNDADAGECRSRCVARAYHVFNAAQVDGFTLPEVPQLAEVERIQWAEQFFQSTGAKILEQGIGACYNWATDEIHMPPFSIFKKADLFYSTLAHESIHFSGHPQRCNRQLANRFGSESYAAEELVALS